VVGLIVSVALIRPCVLSLFCHCTYLHCCVSVLFSSLFMALCSGGNRDPGCVCGVTFTSSVWYFFLVSISSLLIDVFSVLV
jgi:hypothetical protein